MIDHAQGAEGAGSIFQRGGENSRLLATLLDLWIHDKKNNDNSIIEMI